MKVGHPQVEAGGPVSGVPEGESVPVERAGCTSADRGASAGAGGGVRVGSGCAATYAEEVQRRAAAGRDGRGQARRDGGASMVAVLKYGSGVPVLPAGRAASEPRRSLAALDAVGPGEPTRPNDSCWCYEELIQQAAQGEVLYNDDTAVEEPGAAAGEQAADRRRDVHHGHRGDSRRTPHSAVFQRRQASAGENLADVLKRRAAGLPRCRFKCATLCHGTRPSCRRKWRPLMGNCLAHLRRNFARGGAPLYPECRYVLEALGEVYGNDETAREQS